MGNRETGTEEGVTARELRILELVEHGLTNREIADRLWVREQTVKFHLSRIYRKIGAKNRTSAVAWLRRQPAAKLYDDR